MIEIDASHGGQIYRLSLSLSILLQKKVHIHSIRLDRPKPGLMPQHLAVLKTLSGMSNAATEGDFIGSREVIFEPKSFKPKKELIDIGTAGSITLLLQALLLPSIFSKQKISLQVKGGTNVSWSPPAEALTEALFPLIKKMNAECSLKIIRRGYYPKGQGLIEFNSMPCDGLRAINLIEKGVFKKIKIYSNSASLPGHVALEQFNSAKRFLGEKGIKEELIESIIEQNANPSSIGSSISCFALHEHSVLEGNALGSRGKPAGKVGFEAGEKLWNEMQSNAAVDIHLADQLLPFMALAEGNSSLLVPGISSHARTSIEVLEKFLPVKFIIEEKKPNYLIKVKGIGFKQ